MALKLAPALLLLALSLFASQAQASPFSLDLTASAGYANTAVPAGEKTPTIIAFSGGAALKYNLLDWFALGVASEYQSYGQQSDPSATVGNRTGWRWTMAEPMIELHGGSLSLKASYSFLGKYHLPNTTFEGFNDLSYQSPKGLKVAGLTRLGSSSVWGGLYYSQVTYDWANFQTDPLPLKTWQAGLTLELRLF